MGWPDIVNDKAMIIRLLPLVSILILEPPTMFKLSSGYRPDDTVPLRVRSRRVSGKRAWNRDSTSETNLGNKWVLVEGGKFRMGNDNGLSPDESPEHEDTLNSFFMSATEVTFDQYDRFCTSTNRPKPNDNGWGRGDMPVMNVNWNDAYEYCLWASKVTGATVRLPTEAEWEYAARGGGKSHGYEFSGGNHLDDVGWYSENSDRKSHPVGEKRPNELGLYDMTGNVWEWCADWYSDEYYSVSPSKNPRGPVSGTYHVLRGGSWLSTEAYSHVTTRSSLRSDYISVNNGFRVVKDVR